MSIRLRLHATVLILLISASFVIPAYSQAPADQKGDSGQQASDYIALRKLRAVMGIVRKNYLREITDAELVDGAIRGMLQSLDRHSSYLTEDMFRELRVETKEDFGGLGVEITLKDGLITVVSPIDNTPAARAGIAPSDRLIKIEGESTKGMSLVKAIKLMRGKRGTQATLTVMRDGWGQAKEFKLTRDTIHVKPIKQRLLLEGYPYIRLVNFQEGAYSAINEAIKGYGGDEKIKGLILDLRNNPGGLLDQAVKVANLFIDKGLIVYTDGRVKDQRMEFRATTGGRHYKFKMAVLINGGSAAASEIVAGALQDHDRALIFGENSYGNATIQTIIPLESGAGLRLTTAAYYTPKGRMLNKKGIEPDIHVKPETEEQNPARASVTTKGDPTSDLATKEARDWLKSAVAVKEFKFKKMDSSKLLPR